MLDLNPKRSKKNQITIVMILLITICILATSSVSFAKKCNCDALPYEHVEGNDFPCTEGWGGINAFAFEMQELIQKGAPTSYSRFFVVDFQSGTYGYIWASITSFYDNIKVVGLLLVVMFLLLDIIDSSSKDLLNPEFLIKSFIKFIIAFILIDNGLQLLRIGIDFSNSIIRQFTYSEGNNDVAQALVPFYEDYKKFAWWEALPGVITLLIPYLAALVCSVIIILMSWSRYIDIIVRAVFAPIGMANIYDGGGSLMSSSATRYFKKYLAALLQGAIMAAICVASQMLNAPMTTLYGDYLGIIGGSAELLILFCTAMALTKSKTWANDIVGV